MPMSIPSSSQIAVDCKSVHYDPFELGIKDNLLTGLSCDNIYCLPVYEHWHDVRYGLYTSSYHLLFHQSLGASMLDQYLLHDTRCKQIHWAPECYTPSLVLRLELNNNIFNYIGCTHFFIFWKKEFSKIISQEVISIQCTQLLTGKHW